MYSNEIPTKLNSGNAYEKNARRLEEWHIKEND